MDKLFAQIPHRLFTEWQIYYELEPFGSLRDNLHAGIVAASIWQTNLEPGDRSRISPADFLLPDDLVEKESPEPEEIFVMLKAHLVRSEGDPNADR